MPVHARAPLRLSFSGGGSDTQAYSSRYGGLVLSAAIARYVTVIGEIGASVFRSYPEDETDPSYLMKIAGLYHLGPVGLEARIDAPPRSGLGGSGALGVAALGALRTMAAQPLSPWEVAEEAYRFETEVMQNHGGRQDQYAAAFGGLNLISFEGEKVGVKTLELRRETLLALESSLVMVFIHARAGASGRIMAEEAQGVARGDRELLDALSRQKYLALEMARALEAGDLTYFGKTLAEAWETKKKQAVSITNDVVDGVYSLARKAGALGGKLAGAGGGGYMFFIAPERAGEVAEALRAVGLRPENVVFDFRGLAVW